MVDLHCHILPGIDDGPQNLVEFIEMANTAVSEGITTVFATPHHLNGQYENQKEKILAYVAKCNLLLQKHEISLKISPGQELRIHCQLFESLESDEVLTLDNKGKYLLLELPFSEVPIYTNDTIYELLLKGITPIIVHPERNRELIENNDLLFELVQNGALTQLTAGSIIGRFGKKVKSFSQKIIEHNLAHFIATDAHNTSSRRFFLQEAYDSITEQYGIGSTFYFKENAEVVLLGQHPQIKQPIPIRKRIFGIF